MKKEKGGKEQRKGKEWVGQAVAAQVSPYNVAALNTAVREARVLGGQRIIRWTAEIRSCQKSFFRNSSTAILKLVF